MSYAGCKIVVLEAIKQCELKIYTYLKQDFVLTSLEHRAITRLPKLTMYLMEQITQRVKFSPRK